MANRRMFSTKLISSARFIKMPISCQNLYFHLNLHADDDGVVEAFSIMRMTGATEDDLKILVAKKFVVVLNEDLVTYILDWKENNKIRADRKVDSLYKDLLLQILPDVELLETKKRADAKKVEKQAETSVDENWTSTGHDMDGIGKVRLGKVSIGKYSIEKDIEKENLVEVEVETKTETDDSTPVVKDNNSKKNKKSKRKNFTIPTLEEIKLYIEENNYIVDAEIFSDYYESNGWMIGKSKMKDWKATIRNWHRRNEKASSSKTNAKSGPIKQPVNNNNKFHNFNQRTAEYTPEQLKELGKQNFKRKLKEIGLGGN